MWKRESREIQVLLAPKKKANIEVQNFMNALLAVPEDVRNVCLRLYLEACKVRHALAFF